MRHKNVYLVRNKIICNIHFSVRKEQKKISNNAKIIYPYLSFLLWRTKKITWNWRKFLPVSLTNVFLAFSIYKFTFQFRKKTISEVIYSCADDLIEDKPKNVGCNWIAWSPNQSYLSFSVAILHQGLNAPYHFKDNSVNSDNSYPFLWVPLNKSWRHISRSSFRNSCTVK